MFREQTASTLPTRTPFCDIYSTYILDPTAPTQDVIFRHHQYDMKHSFCRESL